MLVRWKIHMLNRRLTRKGWTYRYGCSYEGCEDRISNLRFILVGCICKPHAWLRRWGG